MNQPPTSGSFGATEVSKSPTPTWLPDKDRWSRSLAGRILAPDRSNSGVAARLHHRRRGDTILRRLIGGDCPAGIRFAELRSLLARLQFDEPIRGDKHIFSRPGVDEILNLQPRGSLAKPYR